MRRMVTSAMRLMSQQSGCVRVLGNKSSATMLHTCKLSPRTFRSAAYNGFLSRNASSLMYPGASRCKVSVPPMAHRFSVSAAAMTEVKEETFQYQAEVDRLMDMIVNSLYSNREVFLRELVSNCSDALDKVRFIGLTNPDTFNSGSDLEIRIKADKDAHTITIEDTGVGLTKQELVDSLGTIARSGTAKFAEAMKEAKGDANLIGQFGVGFYSSFLVADRVSVQTKSNDDPSQWYWESSAGSHQFKIREDSEGEPLKRGTRVTLHLKEDAYELADEKKLATLVKQYSEFIQFPIKLWQAKTEYENEVDEEATKKAQEAADAKAKEEGKEAAEPVQAVTKSVPKQVFDWRVQNDNKPLWTRSPKEVTQEEYDSFFKMTFKEFLEPLAVSHFNVEGTIEFTAMLFVPGMAPFEQQNWTEKPKNIKLFVKRVFISDEFDDLMPRYLSFIKGLVDSSDLPLNVSREILQESRVVRVIKRQLVKRALDMLKEIASRPVTEGDGKKDDYATFWENFGKFLKMGCIEDADNKPALAGLLRFPSSKCGEGMASLSDYIGRMKEGQKEIYYMAADSAAAAASAPFVEKLVRKDYEVLYLTEPIDEIALTNVLEFEGKKFADVSREELDLGDSEEEKKKVESAAAELKGLTDFMKETLGDKVEKVVVSARLADSPCALVTSKFGWSANMEKLMKSQTLGDNRAAEYMRGRRTLEINPDHPIVAGLQDALANSIDSAKATTELLYETALVTSGFTVDSPRDFAARIYSMIGLAVGKKGAGSAAAEGAKTSPVVDPEVLGADSNDPWRQ